MFRYAIEVSETNLDPHRISDLYSNIILQGIFDAPLRYDYLARPPKLVPNTLSAMRFFRAPPPRIWLAISMTM